MREKAWVPLTNPGPASGFSSGKGEKQAAARILGVRIAESSIPLRLRGGWTLKIRGFCWISGPKGGPFAKEGRWGLPISPCFPGPGPGRGRGNALFYRADLLEWVVFPWGSGGPSGPNRGPGPGPVPDGGKCDAVYKKSGVREGSGPGPGATPSNPRENEGVAKRRYVKTRHFRAPGFALAR